MIALLNMQGVELFAQISIENLKKHVYYLSSPSLQGRSVNSSSIRKAECYLLKEINNTGLAPGNKDSFRQEFAFIGKTVIPPYKTRLIVGNDTLYNGYNFFSISINPPSKEIVDFPSGRFDYLRFLDGEMNTNKHNQDDRRDMARFKSIFHQVSRKDFLDIVRVNYLGVMEGANDESKFVIPNDSIRNFYLLMQDTGRLRREYSSSLKEIEGKEIALYNDELPVYGPANILGLISGTVGDSTLVISAHYDHIGMEDNQVFPGANDNASGTAALLEIARVLQNFVSANAKPKHNLLFAFFSAEEIGMLGSKYFVSHCPYEISATIANINLDMVGNTDEEHIDTPEFLYAYGKEENSKWLMQKTDSLNQLHQLLNLNFFKNERDKGERFLFLSDQVNFIHKDIPVLFLFNGMSPYYHQIHDTPEKLDYEKMKKVCELTIELIKDIAFDL
jgi:hypothetical protein